MSVDVGRRHHDLPAGSEFVLAADTGRQATGKMRIVTGQWRGRSESAKLIAQMNFHQIIRIK